MVGSQVTGVHVAPAHPLEAPPVPLGSQCIHLYNKFFVLNLKVFSQAACDISRVPDSLASIDKLFCFSLVHLEKARPEDVTSKVHF